MNTDTRLLHTVIAPAQNILNTLALLNSPRTLAMRNPGLRDILSSWTAAQQHQNRLLFEALGDGLMPADEWSSFAQFLDYLSARDPLALREEVVDNLLVQRTRIASPSSASRADKAAALRSALTPPADSARGVYEEAHTLIQQPDRLRAAASTHLRDMWQEYLERDWGRLEATLETLIPYCQQRFARHPDIAVALYSLIGDAVPADVLASLEHQTPIVVISGHMQQSVRHVRTTRQTWLFVGLPPHPALWRRSAIERSELLARLRPLSDESFLIILSLLSQHDELSAQELMRMLNMTQPTASRHLQQLVSSGHVMERRQGGAAKVYRLTPGYIAQTMHALEQHLAADQWMTVPQLARLGNVPAAIQNYVDTAGKVNQWPSRRKDQLAVLDYLASRFSLGENLTEKAVNQRLLQWHTWNDTAFMRRELYNAHYLDRTRNGAKYWRISPDEKAKNKAPVA